MGICGDEELSADAICIVFLQQRHVVTPSGGHMCSCHSGRARANHDDVFGIVSGSQQPVCPVTGFRIEHTPYAPVAWHQIFGVVKLHAPLRAAQARDYIVKYAGVHLVGKSGSHMD